MRGSQQLRRHYGLPVCTGRESRTRLRRHVRDQRTEGRGLKSPAGNANNDSGQGRMDRSVSARPMVAGVACYRMRAQASGSVGRGVFRRGRRTALRCMYA